MLHNGGVIIAALSYTNKISGAYASTTITNFVNTIIISTMLKISLNIFMCSNEVISMSIRLTFLNSTVKLLTTDPHVEAVVVATDIRVELQCYGPI